MKKFNLKKILIVFTLAIALMLGFTSPIFASRDESVRTITTDLKRGSSNNNVQILQQFLISENKGPKAKALSVSGTTQNFGPLTQNALIEWQLAKSISPAVGYFGPKSRLIATAVMAGGSTLLSSITTSTSSAKKETSKNLIDNKLKSGLVAAVALAGVVDNKIVAPEESAIVSTQTGSGFPVLLKIPKINLNATIIQVGLTSDGAIDVAKGPAEAAWYKLGPRPGEKGNAIIDGHFGWKNGIPAVFDNLSKLEPGDKIFVENDQGVTTTFVVRESRKFDPQADALEVFESSDENAHLNIITCAGTWNQEAKSHSDRLVVFTDKI